MVEQKKKFYEKSLKQRYITNYLERKKEIYLHNDDYNTGSYRYDWSGGGLSGSSYVCGSFYDEQELFDISIQSTLGLTEEDIDALLALDGVEKAEGSFSEIVHTKKGDVNKTAEVKVLKINMVQILQ